MRPAHDADDGPARELLTAAGLPLGGLGDSWRRWVVDGSAGLDGVVALERHTGVGRPVYLLRSLVVRPDTRATGVGTALMRAALAGADAHEGGRAAVALLTETAVGYFERFGFTATTREALPQALAGSAELSGACPSSAVAYWRAGAASS
ncbi:GNAT family N-acetyltransferase [Oryzihumus leptocrescens]|uniref:GNAT family N-acetyltransferase n=1 Tax=Oryzihumus leptocrescens TaxID=297536 RepID=UPI0031D9E14D